MDTVTLPTPAWHWVVAVLLLIVFAWVLSSLFVDTLPLPWLDATQPGHKQIAIVLLFVIGIAELFVFDGVMRAVWSGIKHLLLLVIPE